MLKVALETRTVSSAFVWHKLPPNSVRCQSLPAPSRLSWLAQMWVKPLGDQVAELSEVPSQNIFILHPPCLPQTREQRVRNLGQRIWFSQNLTHATVTSSVSHLIWEDSWWRTVSSRWPMPQKPVCGPLSPCPSRVSAAARTSSAPSNPSPHLRVLLGFPANAFLWRLPFMFWLRSE